MTPKELKKFLKEHLKIDEEEIDSFVFYDTAL